MECGSLKDRRNSTIEVLRVIAMFMIVFYHIYCHSITHQLSDGYHLEFDAALFDLKFLILGFAAPLGKIGNVIFILITGYYMTAREQISLSKTAKKLLLQLGFATISVVVGSSLFFILFHEHYSGISYYLANVNMFNEAAWFIGYYFVIILIARLFLNRFLERLSKEHYCEFVLTLFALTQFSWVVDNLRSVASGLTTLSAGIFLYSLGGLIRKHSFFRDIKAQFFALVIIVSCGFIALSNYNSVITEIQRYQNEGIFIPNIVQYTDNSIVPIIIGVSVFALFERMKPFYSSIINFLGASMLMVYLMHDNEFFYALFNATNWVGVLHESPVKFLLLQFGWTIFVLVVGIVAYLVFNLISTFIGSIIRKKNSQ